MCYEEIPQSLKVLTLRTPRDKGKNPWVLMKSQSIFISAKGSGRRHDLLHLQPPLPRSALAPFR